VSEKKVVNQMPEYRDLLILTEYLTEKEDSLRLWITLVDQREKDSKARVVLPVLEKANKDLIQAKIALKQMQALLQQSNKNLLALPTDIEEKKINLFARTAGSIEQLMKMNKASRNVTDYQQRWSRVKGVFLWQMNSTKVSKQWELKQQLVATERLIRKADIQLLETRLANQWSPASWQGMKTKIVTTLSKTSALKVLAEEAKTESKTALLVSSTTYLNELTFRINDYLSQSRLSIARLYDDALQDYVASGELDDGGSNNE
jgi:hypothetical protein